MRREQLLMGWMAVLTIGCVTILTLWLSGMGKKQEIAYVEITTLFKDFTMTKNLQSKMNSAMNQRKYILDSMEMRLRSRFDRGEQNQPGYRDEAMRFQEQKQFSEEENARLKATYDEQIFTQLHQYVKEYGDANGIDYIFISEPQSIFVPAGNARNLTQEVLEYANQKFEGK